MREVVIVDLNVLGKYDPSLSLSLNSLIRRNLRFYVLKTLSLSLSLSREWSDIYIG